MGSHNFTWRHYANEVYITGTFDNWSKSVRLDNHNGVFSKTVDLPSATDNIYYKFVVDGNWVTDQDQPGEHDYSGNWNNVLKSHDITPHPVQQQQQTSRDTRPAPRGAESYMASKHMPGAFPPETPMGEAQGFSLPTMSGTGTSSTGSATRQAPQEHKEEEERSFGVSPLPASSGTSNPISLRPGEPVPSSESYTSHDMQSNVHYDKESYERSDALPGQSFSGYNSSGSNAFSLPFIGGMNSGTMIPESSLPMGSSRDFERDAGPFMRSSGAGTSAAALAGQVPREPRALPEVVPQVVRQSQQQAHADPEASASPEAVHEKSEVEQELKKYVSREPAASDGTAGSKNSKEDSSSGPSSSVPQVVAKSQQRAHVDPEASASSSAVTHKHEMESELQRQVSRETETRQNTAGPYGSSDSSVPQVVAMSQQRAHVDPEASASSSAVAHKHEMESELQRQVSKETETRQNTAAPYSTSDYGYSGPSQGMAAVSNAQRSYLESAPDPKAAVSSAQRSYLESAPMDVEQSDPKAAVSSAQKSYLESAPDPKAAVSSAQRSYLESAPMDVEQSDPKAAVSSAQRSYLESAPDPKAAVSSAQRSYLESAPMDVEQSGSANAVPEIVTKSQHRAHAEPEASSSSTAVAHKQEMENELQRQVSREPAIQQSSSSDLSHQVEHAGEVAHHAGELALAGGAALLGSAAAGIAALSHNLPASLQNASHSVIPSSISSFISNMNIGGASQRTSQPTQHVPEAVTQSIARSGQSPEATVNPEAVSEKSAMEKELLAEVSTTNERGAQAPDYSQASSGGAIFGSTAPRAGHEHESNTQAASSYVPVPEPVTESYQRAHQDPEAAANPEAVSEKATFERELLSEVPRHNESGEPAPSQSAALSAIAPTTTSRHAAEQQSATSRTSSDPFANDPVSAPGGARSVASERYSVPLESVAAFRDDPISATHAQQSSTSSNPFANDPVSAPGGARSVAPEHYSVPLDSVAAFRNDPVSASQSSATHAQQSSTSSDPFANDPVSAPGGARSIAPERYSVPLESVAAFRDDPVSASHAQQSQSGAQDDYYTQSAHSANQNQGYVVGAASAGTHASATSDYSRGQTDQSQGYIGGSTGETIASYIPGTQANAASKEASSEYAGQSQSYPLGSTGETIASYIPGTQANAASKEVSSEYAGQSQSYPLGSTGETIASYIPGTQANTASKEAESSSDYSPAYDRETHGYDSRSQGYVGGSTGETVASYIPGTEANAASKGFSGSSDYSQGYSSQGQSYAGGSTGETIASYIPGTEANAASKEYSSGSGYSQGYNNQAQRAAETIASYIPGTGAHAASKAPSSSPGFGSAAQDSYARETTSYTQETPSYGQSSTSYSQDSYAPSTLAQTSYPSTTHHTGPSSDFISSLPQGGPSSFLSDLQTTSYPSESTTAYTSEPATTYQAAAESNSSYETTVEPMSANSGSGLRAAEVGGASLMTAAAIAGTHSLTEHAPAHTTTYTSQGSSALEGPLSSGSQAPLSSDYTAPLSSSTYEAPASSSTYETAAPVTREAPISAPVVAPVVAPVTAAPVVATPVSSARIPSASIPSAREERLSSAPTPSTRQERISSVPREGGALSSARAAMASIRKSTSSARKPSASASAAAAALKSSGRPVSMQATPIAASSSTAAPVSSGLGATSGLNAPASHPAQVPGSEPIASQGPSTSTSTGGAMKEALSSKARTDSRDVSPFSKQAAGVPATATEAGPSVTTGVASGSTPVRTTGTTAPSTPQTLRTTGASGSAAASPSTTAGGSSRSTPAGAGQTQEDKKKKRRSIFGKIKEKLRDL